MDARTSNWGNDLREFVDRLDRNNDLKTFSNADWNLEIGALTEIGAEQNGPALMFDKIKGYPPGFRVLSNFLQAQERTAMTLGLPRELAGVKLLNAWREKLRDFKPMPPRTVSDGPVLENVMEGDAVDLGAFPTPLWHEHDGGRYHRHRRRRDHARSGHRRGQCRHLSLHDPGQEPHQREDEQRQARPARHAEVSRHGQALPDRGLGRPCAAAVHRRHHADAARRRGISASPAGSAARRSK